ncbi:hypothetical protein [Candidatus Phytoplasma asiaticum]
MLGNLLAPFGRGLFVIFDNYQRNANNLSVLNLIIFFLKLNQKI